MVRMRMRRMALAAYDACAIAVVAALFSCGVPHVAWAYVDPSVLTYTIQALAGVAVALSAVAGVMFRRTRRTIMRVFGIDENARKEVELPVVRTDGDQASSGQGVTASASAGGDASQGAGEKAERTMLQRWLLPAIVSVFFSFTLFVVAPLEMVAGSAGSLVIGVWQLWPVVAGLGLAVAVAVAAVLALLPQNASLRACLVVACLGACCWLQALFMNTGLPTADGHGIDLADFAPLVILSAVVWLAVIVVPQLLVGRARKAVLAGAGAVAIALVIVQGVGVASLFLPTDRDIYDHSYVTTEKGMFTVSSGTNVVVFVLDNYDTAFLEQAVKDDPHLLDGFTGFTWYTNSTAAMIPTRYGIPFLLTGEKPHEDERFSEFLAQRYVRSTYLSDIESTGATMGIYSDTLGLQYMSDEQAADAVYSKGMNYVRADEVPIDTPRAALMLAKCALYRDAPWLAKPAFWFYTDEVNEALVQHGENGELDLTPYTISDGRWYLQLQETGLSIDEQGDRPAFRFIHLLGAHAPFNVDENGVDVGLDGSTQGQQARGSMRMVGEYLDQLKRLGVYDQTTVVITADHGNWYIIDHPVEVAATPIMLVKPAGAPDAPLVQSDVAVQAGDVMPTVLDALGSAAAAQHGTPIPDLVGTDRVRTYLMTTSNGAHDQEIIEFEIQGDARDIANWHLTGTSWPAQE